VIESWTSNFNEKKFSSKFDGAAYVYGTKAYVAAIGGKGIA